MPLGVTIEVAGRLALPGAAILAAATIIEPGTVLFAGPQAEISLGEMNTLYPGCILRLEPGFVHTGRRVSFSPGCVVY